MRKALLTCLALTAVGATAPVFVARAVPSQISEEAARASVVPFYDALTAAPGKDVIGLLRRATAPDWVSCGTNEVCQPRDQVIAAIAARHTAIPDLRWEIKDVLVSGNRVTVRGEASGTPTAEFMGVPHGGRSFRIMSIDVHTIDAGTITRSYHIEDWRSAVRQLSGG